MSWRLAVSVGIVAALSIGAVVVAIVSVRGPGGADRIKEAIRWPTTCAGVAVHDPSHAPIMGTWASLTVQTADIVCGPDGPRVAYARFRDRETLDRAMAAREPRQRYCTIGASIVIDGLSGVDPTAFTDMCALLRGTFFNAVR